jgi:hypothetical protein
MATHATTKIIAILKRFDPRQNRMITSVIKTARKILDSAINKKNQSNAGLASL